MRRGARGSGGPSLTSDVSAGATLTCPADRGPGTRGAAARGLRDGARLLRRDRAAPGRRPRRAERAARSGAGCRTAGARPRLDPRLRAPPPSGTARRGRSSPRPRPGSWDDGSSPTVVSDRVDTVFSQGSAQDGTASVRIRADKLGTLRPDGAFVPDTGTVDVVVGLTQNNGVWRLASRAARHDRAAFRPPGEHPPGAHLVPRGGRRGTGGGDPLPRDEPRPLRARPRARRAVLRPLGRPAGRGAVRAAAGSAAAARRSAPPPRGSRRWTSPGSGRWRPSTRAGAPRSPSRWSSRSRASGVDRVRLTVDGAPLLDGRPELGVADVLAGLPPTVRDRQDLPSDRTAGDAAAMAPAVVVTGGRVRAVPQDAAGGADAGRPAAPDLVTGVAGRPQREHDARRAQRRRRRARGRDDAAVRGAGRRRGRRRRRSPGRRWPARRGPRTARRCGRCSTADRCGRCAAGRRRTRRCSPRSRSTRHRSPGLGPITTLRLSPDGAKVALVAGGRVVIAAVVRDGAGGARLGAMRVLRSGPRRSRSTGVLDVGWSQTDRLVAVGDRAGRPVQLVSVDGLDLETAPTTNLTPPVTAVAAARTARRWSSTRAALWTLPLGGDSGSDDVWRPVPGVRTPPPCPPIRAERTASRRAPRAVPIGRCVPRHDATLAVQQPRRAARRRRRRAASTASSHALRALADLLLPAPCPGCGADGRTRCARRAGPRCAARCRLDLPGLPPGDRARALRRASPRARSSPTRNGAGGSSPARWPARSAARWPASDGPLPARPGALTRRRGAGPRGRPRAAPRPPVVRDGHGHVVPALALGRRARGTQWASTPPPGRQPRRPPARASRGAASCRAVLAGGAARRRPHHRRDRAALRAGPRRGRAGRWTRSSCSPWRDPRARRSLVRRRRPWRGAGSPGRTAPGADHAPGASSARGLDPGAAPSDLPETGRSHYGDPLTGQVNDRRRERRSSTRSGPREERCPQRSSPGGTAPPGDRGGAPIPSGVVLETVLCGRNVEVPQHFREHMAEKLSRLERYDHKIVRMEVQLSHETEPPPGQELPERGDHRSRTRTRRAGRGCSADFYCAWTRPCSVSRPVCAAPTTVG